MSVNSHPFIYKHPLWSAFLTFAGFHLAMLLVALLLTPLAYANMGVFLLAYGVLVVLLPLWLLRRLYPKTETGLQRARFWRGLRLGLPCFLLVEIGMLLFFGIGKFHLLRQEFEMAPGLMIIILFAIFLVLAFLEEVVFRGLLLNMLLERWGDSRRGIYAAILVAAALFGIAHYSLEYTAFPRHNFRSVLNAFYIGVFWGAVYLRCRNLWVTTVLHAAANTVRTLVSVLTLAGQFSFFGGTVLALRLMQQILFFTFWALPIGLWLARKLQPRDDTPDLRRLNWPLWDEVPADFQDWQAPPQGYWEPFGEAVG